MLCSTSSPPAPLLCMWHGSDGFLQISQGLPLNRSSTAWSSMRLGFNDLTFKINHFYDFDGVTM